MLKFNKKILFKYYVFIISFILVCFSIYRALNSGITYDEAFSYLLFIKENFISTIVNMKSLLIPNNHILNTLLISILTNITGLKYCDFLIRIPSLLSYVFYFIISYKISKNYKNNFLCFSLLAFNYGLNEYGSLARGYCMATFFTVLSLLFFQKYIKTHDFKFIKYFCYSSLLACYSNTVCLIMYGSFLVLIFIKLLKDGCWYNFIKNNFFQIAIIFILSLLIIIFHFSVTINSKIYIYGSETNFFDSFLCSLFYMYGFFVKYWYSNGHIMYSSNYILIGSFILVTVIIIFINLKKLKNNYLFYSFLICMFIIITVTLLTGSKWIMGRCVIPFIPWFSIWIMEIVDNLEIKSKYMNICSFIAIIIIIAVFCFNLSLKYTRDYNRDIVISELANEAYKLKNNYTVKKYRYEMKMGYNDLHQSFYYYQQKYLLKYNYDISK